MIALLLALVTAAPAAPRTAAAPQPQRLPADGRIATPEGVRFQLPRGQEYTAGTTEDGTRVYATRPRDDTSHVSVQVVSDEVPSACSGASGGSEVAVLRTASGLAGCLVSRASDDDELFVTVALVRGRGVLVVILAAAASDGAARQLALRTAESVEIGAPSGAAAPPPLPRTDPRMVGCFERSLSYSNSYTLGSARAFWTRCLRDDFTFVESFGASSTVRERGTGEGSTVTGGTPDRQGTWSYASGTLVLAYEGGEPQSWDVTFGDSGVLLGNELWTRTPERPDSPDEEWEEEEDVE